MYGGRNTMKERRNLFLFLLLALHGIISVEGTHQRVRGNIQGRNRYGQYQHQRQLQEQGRHHQVYDDDVPRKLVLLRRNHRELQKDKDKDKKQKLKVDCDAIYDGNLDKKFIKKFVKKCDHLPFTDMPSVMPSFRPSDVPSIRPSKLIQPR